MSKPTFYGHELTSDSIHVNPCKKKIAAIGDARPPKDASEVQLFMDLVQYSSKFMPDIVSMAKPIQAYSPERVSCFTEQQTAFEELKHLNTQVETLANFKVGC